MWSKIEAQQSNEMGVGGIYPSLIIIHDKKPFLTQNILLEAQGTYFQDNKIYKSNCKGIYFKRITSTKLGSFSLDSNL